MSPQKRTRLGGGWRDVHILIIPQNVDSDRLRELELVILLPDDIQPMIIPQEPIQQWTRRNLRYRSATPKRGGNQT